MTSEEQRRNGLFEDGVLGPKTAQAIKEVSLTEASKADLLYHVDTLTARLEAVRELHKPVDFGDGDQYCDMCVEAFPWGGESIPYPCPTIQALDGDT